MGVNESAEWTLPTIPCKWLTRRSTKWVLIPFVRPATRACYNQKSWWAAPRATSLSLTLVDAQLPLDIAHTEQQNYLNDQLRIMTEEAQRKRLEEEEVLSRLRQTRERLEGTLLFKLGWVRKNCRPKPNTQGVTQVTGDAKNVFRKKIWWGKLWFEPMFLVWWSGDCF